MDGDVEASSVLVECRVLAVHRHDVLVQHLTTTSQRYCAQLSAQVWLVQDRAEPAEGSAKAWREPRIVGRLTCQGPWRWSAASTVMASLALCVRPCEYRTATISDPLAMTSGDGFAGELNRANSCPRKGNVVVQGPAGDLAEATPMPPVDGQPTHGESVPRKGAEPGTPVQVAMSGWGLLSFVWKSRYGSPGRLPTTVCLT